MLFTVCIHDEKFAIVRPDLDVTVLDSNGKKARFLRHVARTLSQANVTVAEARVEDWKPPVPYRVVTSRAFASLAEFFTVTTDLSYNLACTNRQRVGGVISDVTFTG